MLLDDDDMMILKKLFIYFFEFFTPVLIGQWQQISSSLSILNALNSSSDL